ncbi:uncharacterized protein [Gossypium hirsutum]|uniref:DNA/RNA polymerases superfamily protein n=1 Tax=Gossypium hirsutum TaxID=3635 RepID=A0A1U8P9Z9_GOSHI|nr:uncharacterized protein LOC107957101 [Gossypium hirsutum]
MEDEEVVVIRECRNYLSNVISALRAEKLVRKGCEAYLAYIRDTEVKSPTIEEQVENDERSDFGMNNEGVLCFCGRMCIPKDNDLRQSILREAHSNLYAMHPGGNKMYRNLGELYWCQTPTCWTELGERRLLGPELVADTEDKVKLIRDRLKEASDREKSYADLRHREIEYAVGDLVFLKVSPWKKVFRFGQKGKLSPRFIRPYRVIRRIGPVTYQLELPPKLSQIHDMFHVSMLRWYRSDPSHVVAVEEIEVRLDLTFEEEPIQIIGHDVKVLRMKSVPLVKVLWHNHKAEEATWEPEEAMQRQYP